ncbi:hypothetical protein BXZ70DRAFT_997738 [Cristinia sonorae]|uniref:LIM zinc-binding domain-containing protein n=1 Tax=Cristinia sonorae TaxID=1940300 RepID=A0A8K0UZB3_9AGAR|nr:hypothetical protein BXZ70DRAFT_997738 [Cristinia sonorae]
MAQLLSPTQGPARISQILPTVKCSNCNAPVPISELGEHVCSKPPPMPSLRPPMSPRSASDFLPQKYANLVSPRSNSPLAQQPSRTPPPQQQLPPLPRIGTPARQPSPSPQQTRQRAPSTSSYASSRSTATYTDHSGGSSSRGGASQQQGNGLVAFPSRGEPAGPPRQPHPGSRASTSARSISTTSSSNGPSSPASESSGSRKSFQGGRPPPGALASRSRAPSNASLRPVPPNAFRQPAQSSPTPYVPPPSGPAPLGALSPTSPRPRAITNAGGPPEFQTGPDVIYSTGNRSPIANYDTRARVPSNASANSTNSYMHTPPMPSPPQMSFPSPEIEIDTKIGGAAGMAGVGRRGFAAAARAAMFAHNVPQGGGANVVTNMNGVQGMDGRRANAPKFLDIASAQNYAANTPPLSPNSASSHSPRSPLSANLPSPSKDGRGSTTPTRPAIASSRTPSPSNPYIQDAGVVSSPALDPPKSPMMPTTPSSAPVKLPFFEKFKNKVDTAPIVVEEESPLSPLSPQSESSYGGLAYANDTEDEDEKPPPASAPAATRQHFEGHEDDNAPPVPPPKSATVTNRVHFPSMSSKTDSIAGKSESNYSSASPAASPRLPMRSLSAASTAASAYALRSAAKSTGALDRSMETLFEEDPASPSNSSPAGLGFPLGESQRDSKPPKLPTRSHTSPTMGSGRPDSRHAAVVGKRRERTSKKVCLKCDKHIDDGRWIQMDGGGVLCDKCWKNMYLPKCRRCSKTIEKQAISSSDGQLKGKYHRECFTCHTCQKPFPDKTFYVFDGKPFCAYHYHEANDSLCAATLCGQPIEGPCAVSHAGDKYHPEHLLCENPRCSERLVEYWEVAGRMLCEKHAMAARAGEDDEDDLRAMRRVTQFIDLANLAPGLG